MTKSADFSTRHRRAVEMLHITQGERVLEIGCGHGLATGLALAAGALVTALDQSGKMIAACARRNGTPPALTLVESRFEAFVPAAPFDAALAVNVDFPLHTDRGWAQQFRAVLKPAGRLVLALESPGPQRAARFADLAATSLADAGFATDIRIEDRLALVMGRRD
jgi:SAM-dependent methyltransferase